MKKKIKADDLLETRETAWVVSGKMAGCEEGYDVVAVFDSKPSDEQVEDAFKAYTEEAKDGDDDDAMWRAYYDGFNGGEVHVDEVKLLG